MRCIRDMQIGEIGYCVSWAIRGDEINGLYSVGERGGSRDMQICRYDRYVFSVHPPSGHTFATLDDQVPCIFNKGGDVE